MKQNDEQTENSKICVVATNGQSLINFRGTLIKEMIAQGQTVTCVSIEEDSEMGDKIRNLGAEYYQVDGSRTGIGPISCLKMIFEYKKMFSNVKPDSCFLYMSKPIAFGGVAAILNQVKHIHILVNGLENAYYRTGMKDFIVRCVMSFFYRIVSSKADNVFFQNHDDMAYFKEHHLLTKNNACVVNGSGVDMEYFDKADLPEEPVILMVARLLWSKGIREFLAAVEEVKKKHPQIKVLLVGGLDENDEAIRKEELEEYISKVDIEYCGFARDVRPFLRRCSIFVLPSYHEGLPRCVLEAMAVGRPIITTKVPGCRETVVDGVNGYLVPERDSVILAERICRLVEDLNLCKQMAENSHKMCEEKFEVSKINKIMMNRMKKEM